jgi:hypothetical protein
MKNLEKIVSAVLLLAFFSLQWAWADGGKPIIERKLGRVEVKKGGEPDWRMVATNKILDEKGEGRTMEKSVARIHLWDSRTFALMEEKCTVRFEDVIKAGQKSIMVFNQDTGKIWVSINREKSGRQGFQVKTPQALLAVQGTTFYVRVGRAPRDKEAPPEEVADYIDTAVKSEAEKESRPRDDVPPGSYITPGAGWMIGGGGGASGPAPGDAGFTKVGVLKGSVRVETGAGDPISVGEGQTVIIWDNEKPVILKPDPYLGKKTNLPRTVADEVPEMPENGRPGDFVNVPMNPSNHPSGSSGPGSTQPGCHGPCY